MKETDIKTPQGIKLHYFDGSSESFMMGVDLKDDRSIHSHLDKLLSSGQWWHVGNGFYINLDKVKSVQCFD